jgi:aspartate kinase
VLQIRSVEMAMKHGVRLQVLSSFEDKPGTLVVDEDEIMEQELVSGIAYSRDEAKITLLKVADRPGIAASIFGPLADANINVDMIVQNVSESGDTTDMTFTVSKADFERAKQVIEGQRNQVQFAGMIADSNVVKVSVIGVGMRSHAGIAQRMFKALAEKGINIQVISTRRSRSACWWRRNIPELAHAPCTPQRTWTPPRGIGDKRPYGSCARRGIAEPPVEARNRVSRLPLRHHAWGHDLVSSAIWSGSPMRAGSA